MNGIVVASTKVPRQYQVEAFINEVKNIAKHYDCEIIAMKCMRGFGCYNYGIKIKGDRWEEFANGFTMVMQPGKWSTNSEIYEGFSFEDLPQ